MLRFTKMNGAGNDFVLIDNRSDAYKLSPEQIGFLCDRHRGVGADGVLLVEAPAGKADFRMRYFNSDGELVTLEMSPPLDLVLRRTLEIGGVKLSTHSVNTGVPHVVTFVDDIESTPVQHWGAQIRYHPAFQPNGTNANFIKDLRT